MGKGKLTIKVRAKHPEPHRDYEAARKRLRETRLDFEDYPSACHWAAAMEAMARFQDAWFARADHD